MTKKTKNTPEQRLKDHKRFMKVMLWIALGILVATWGWYFVNFPFGVSDDQQVWGVFGDFVGGVLNPFFAFLALFALLYTIVLQVEELQEMRKEFTKTVDASQHQTFESTFFQMLRLHHDVVGNVATKSTVRAMQKGAEPVLTGRAAFKRFCEILDEHLEITTLTEEESDQKSDEVMAAEIREDIGNSWLAFFAASHDELSHYFRQLYNILLFIDSSKVITDKDQYSRVLRAQLSLYELKLLFYNGLAKKNAPFKVLTERYALFEQISIVPFSKASQGRIDRNHYQFYKREAYGDWTPPEPNYDKNAWKEAMKAVENEAKDYKGETD